MLGLPKPRLVGIKQHKTIALGPIALQIVLMKQDYILAFGERNNRCRVGYIALPGIGVNDSSSWPDVVHRIEQNVGLPQPIARAPALLHDVRIFFSGAVHRRMIGAIQANIVDTEALC